WHPPLRGAIGRNVDRWKAGSAVRLAGLPLKHVADGHAEDLGNAERCFQRRRILVLLDGGDCLPRHVNAVGEFLLGHLAMVEAQPPDAVAARRPRHQPSIRKRAMTMISASTLVTTPASSSALAMMMVTLPTGSAGNAAATSLPHTRLA